MEEYRVVLKAYNSGNGQTIEREEEILPEYLDGLQFEVPYVDGSSKRIEDILAEKVSETGRPLRLEITLKLSE